MRQHYVNISKLNKLEYKTSKQVRFKSNRRKRKNVILFDDLGYLQCKYCL